MDKRDSFVQLLTYDAEKFVVESYRVLLGRDPDKNGANHYLNLLSNGARREDVLIDIMLSPECRREELPNAINNILKKESWKRLPLVRWIAAKANRSAVLSRKIDFLEARVSELTAEVNNFSSQLGKLCISAHHAAQFEKMTALSLSW